MSSFFFRESIVFFTPPGAYINLMYFLCISSLVKVCCDPHPFIAQIKPRLLANSTTDCRPQSAQVRTSVTGDLDLGLGLGELGLRLDDILRFFGFDPDPDFDSNCASEIASTDVVTADIDAVSATGADTGAEVDAEDESDIGAEAQSVASELDMYEYTVIQGESW